MDLHFKKMGLDARERDKGAALFVLERRQS
jgi:hypothetical protein